MTTPSEDYCLIPLTRGQFAKVSPHRFNELSQFSWVPKWDEKGQTFYAMRNITTGGKRGVVFMHRLVLGLEKGDKRHGDHINHDTLDNRDGNLRIATCAQNQANSKPSDGSSSRFKGVHRHCGKNTERWLASITVNRKRHHIAVFPFTPEGEIAAAMAYDAVAKERFGNFAYLNFPVEATSCPEAPGADLQRPQ